ncbi:MAG: dihydrofolate reductase family protein [Balneolaceae bacterium]|nr:dihydrofolate reductase family protein [Balneolaceae bacterium]
MTELIYHIATTADGFIAGPNGESDDSIFIYDDKDLTGDFLESVKQYDAVLMGATTYAIGFQFGLKPGEPSGVALAAKPDLKHYIFSGSMDFEPTKTVEIVHEDAVQFTRKLKKSSTNQKIWLCGGASLAGTLLDANLIDRLILKVNPIVIGNGIPLFAGTQKKATLKHEDCKTYKSGAKLINYRIVNS